MRLEMTDFGMSHGTYEAFRASGWSDAQMIKLGYAKPGLPTFAEAKSAVDARTETPIDVFVYHNEPIENGKAEFRRQLIDVLNYVATQYGK